jgi:DNA repair protein RecN (Recombination protein N)
MLTDLIIKNFAIIDSLHVAFPPGLIMLTGETGAGKSIIIDAISLILGGRASADMIRTGEEDASIECLFDISGRDDMQHSLAEAGLETGDELLVRRVLSRSGKNRIFLNGSLATAGLVAGIVGRLVAIYGQHESQTLLRSEAHLTLLDGFAGLGPLRERFSGLFEEYRRTLEAISHLEAGEREAFRRADLLTFQVREITDAALVPGEDDALEEERRRLLHGEKLIRLSTEAYDALYEGHSSILGILRSLIAGLADGEKFDAVLAQAATPLNDAYLQLEDAALFLRDYSSRLEADPDRLRQVEDRLDLLYKLKKKYAPTLDGIIAFKQASAVELATLEHREARHEQLQEQLRLGAQALDETGDELSRRRRDAAGKLQTMMERELAELAMKNARFMVSFSILAEPRATGKERVEFLFSSNPGEDPKPLAKIASGGELSRLMLAFKQIHPESDVPTLIFDEVDAGIGGSVSAMVGTKLKRVSRQQQVMCITHLPQVAAFADHHFKVVKTTEQGRTRTGLNLLTGESRVEEMARMLGGAKITDRTREHAREMIDDGQRCPAADVG